MKRLTFLLASFMGITLTSFASDAPRGSLLELHSCEVYAGPCMINSEGTTEGRYMVRAWDFAGGKFNGTDLAGLQVAALQTSADNLAEADAKSAHAIVYLPKNATQVQRDALFAWLKSNQSDLASAKIETHVAPLHFTKSEDGYAFNAGNFVSIKTAPLVQCTVASCGEMLWYHPRTKTSLFTVAVNSQSKISEPLVKLKWSSNGDRSIFLARFGDEAPARNLYVSLTELCGETKSLF